MVQFDVPLFVRQSFNRRISHVFLFILEHCRGNIACINYMLASTQSAWFFSNSAENEEANTKASNWL